jgi:hypothetical protein
MAQQHEMGLLHEFLLTWVIIDRVASIREMVVARVEVKWVKRNLFRWQFVSKMEN